MSKSILVPLSTFAVQSELFYPYLIARISVNCLIKSNFSLIPFLIIPNVGDKFCSAVIAD